jgi:hypothetical protein
MTMMHSISQYGQELSKTYTPVFTPPIPPPVITSPTIIERIREIPQRLPDHEKIALAAIVAIAVVGCVALVTHSSQNSHRYRNYESFRDPFEMAFTMITYPYIIIKTVSIQMTVAVIDLMSKIIELITAMVKEERRYSWYEYAPYPGSYWWNNYWLYSSYGYGYRKPSYSLTLNYFSKDGKTQRPKKESTTGKIRTALANTVRRPAIEAPKSVLSTAIELPSKAVSTVAEKASRVVRPVRIEEVD